MEETAWIRNMDREAFPRLSIDQEADVVIVGGGMAGMISAYLVVREGKRVIVVEKDRIGSGATGATTAFLTQIIDTDASDLIRTLGKKKAKLVMDSHKLAIDLIEEIIEREHIDCDFMRCSDFIYANDVKDAAGLREEYHCLKDLGLGVSLADEASRNIGFTAGAVIEVKNQAKFHPIKFLYALADIIVRDGGGLSSRAQR